VIAITLGVIALFAGDPYGGTTIKVNEKILPYQPLEILIKYL